MDARPVLVGGLATIRSFRLVLLIPGEIDPVVDGKLPLPPSETDWKGLQLNWHNEVIVLPAGQVRGQIVSIGWTESPMQATQRLKRKSDIETLTSHRKPYPA